MHPRSHIRSFLRLATKCQPAPVLPDRFHSLEPETTLVDLGSKSVEKALGGSHLSLPQVGSMLSDLDGSRPAESRLGGIFVPSRVEETRHGLEAGTSGESTGLGHFGPLFRGVDRHRIAGAEMASRIL